MKYFPLLNNKKIKKPEEIKTQFLADVEFGILSKNCRNFGICRIIPVGSIQQVDEKKRCKTVSIKAIITLYNKKHVELDFLKFTISPQVYQKFFRDNYFLIEETFQDNFFADLNYHCTILPGKYETIETNGLIKIICNYSRD